MTYCKETQNSSTAIQNIIKRTDLDCESVFHLTLCMFVCMSVCLNNNLLCIYLVGDDMLIMSSMRCLGLLLIPIKMKQSDGDIPFLMTFVPVSHITL